MLFVRENVDEGMAFINNEAWRDLLSHDVRNILFAIGIFYSVQLLKKKNLCLTYDKAV